MAEARILVGGAKSLVLAMLALLTALASGANGANAREIQFGDENIAVELVANSAPKPGQDWLLALHFTPRSQEWHGYWSNPGDAGQGMTLEWQLPDGWEAGEPLYPMPQQLVLSGLMNHVFEGEYAVLVPIRIPADADQAAISRAKPVSVRVEYLACTDKICVPQDAELTLDPALVGKDPRFAEWRAAVVPMLDKKGGFELTSSVLRIGIPLPAGLALDDPHVFLNTSDLGGGLQPLYADPQRFMRQGNLLIAEIPLEQLQLPPGSSALAIPKVEQVEGILAFSQGDGVRFVAEPADVPLEGHKPLADSSTSVPPLWSLALAAFAGGLLLNILPCVFPILSLKALSLARAGGDEAAAKRDALAYTAGVVLACIGLGITLLALRSAGEAVGWAFQLQEPRVVIGLFLLTTALTVNFLGLFEIPGMSFASGGSKRDSSSFVTGLLAAFIATPCTGPFMAAALGAALVLPWPEALILFACLGLGLALPFLLLGFVPALRRRLPKPGPWMERFRKWMALPMGLTVMALGWLLWRMGGWTFLAAIAITALAMIGVLAIYGRRQGKGVAAGGWAMLAVAIAFAPLIFLPPFSSGQPSASESLLDPEPFSEAALARARKSGQPVFLWFTADWCVTCKVNEQVAIEREATQKAFADAGVIALRADWTHRGNTEITDFLTEQGVAGIPLYIWYPPGEEGEQLPQILAPDMLADLAQDQLRERDNGIAR